MAKPKKTTTKELPFAKQPPLITILSDHAVAGREITELGDEVSFIADKDLLTLESRLSSTFDILRHRNTQCPMAIAVYGDWGTGKTSAMRWLETQLKTWNAEDTERHGHPRAYPVWFDPWRYHTKEEVWRGIIAEVILSLFHISSLDREHLLPRMVQAAKRFGGFLGRSFIHALANMELEIEPEVAASKLGKLSIKGEAFRDIWQEYERTEQPHKAHLNQFEDTLRTWVADYLSEDKELGTENARIVLFIDDLDRCMPEVALEVLEALKLYLNIPHLIFVVGLDRDVVNAAVAKRYKEMGVAEEKARHYLHKIFQVELTIPPSEAQMGDFMEHQIKALDKATNSYWRKMLDESRHRETLETVLTELARNNPREVKRLLNSALIRGRAAALDPVLDEKLGATHEDRALRFAQGVQVLLLQRLIQERLVHCENLLIPKRHLEWFERTSALLRDALESSSATVESIIAGLNRIAAVNGDGIWTRNAKVGHMDLTLEVGLLQLGSLKQHLSTDQFLDDRRNPIDPAFLTTESFLNLLSVPFSQDVAQSAPRIEKSESRERQLATIGQLIDLPTNAFERLAMAAEVSVVEFSQEDLVKVESLDWSSVGGLEPRHLSILGFTSNLKELNLRGCSSVSDLSALAELTGLESLNLRDCAGVSELTPLARLTNLRRLILADCIMVNELSPLAELRLLMDLSLSGCTGVSDLGPLSSLKSLEVLSVSGCPGVTDLGSLRGLARLRRLYVSSCDGVSDLRPLAALVRLKELSLQDCRWVSDLEPLYGLVEVELLDLRGCTCVIPEMFDRLSEKLPKCRILAP